MSTASVSSYRRSLTIDHTRVCNTDQRNFPLLVRLCDPTLRSTASGGHVAHPHGTDLFFTQADGRTRLPCELVAYDPEQGQLEAWVEVPDPIASPRRGSVSVLRRFGRCRNGTGPGRLGGRVWLWCNTEIR